MKKGLIVLLILILIVGAFFAGSKIGFNSSTEVSSHTNENENAEPSEFEDVYYEVPDTNSYVVENTSSEMAYPTKGFYRIGRDCDTLLKIYDWHIGVPDESWSNVVIKNSNRQGFYLENSYAVEINTWSDWQIDNALIYNPDYITLWSTDSDDFIPFYVLDDFTIVLGSSDNETRIIIEEVIDVNANGSIIRTKIDRFGFENDEYDVYYFVSSLEKLLTFYTEETGEDMYTIGGDYRGSSERVIHYE